jgi:hypothetical protein
MIETHEKIKSLLKILGFSPEENSKGVYFKKYSNNKNYIRGVL